MMLEPYYTPDDCSVFPHVNVSFRECPCCEKSKWMIDVGFLWWGLLWATGFEMEDFQ